jgi:uncharacterized protein (TIGR00369 family)
MTDTPGKERERISGVLPWTRSCFVCGQDNPRGLRLRSRLENGIVVLEYTTRETDLGWRHLVHGGVSMTLLDEVMTWAAIIAARKACVAAEMTSRLVEPVAAGCLVRAEGWVTTARSRLVLTEGRLQGDAGKVLARASGKYVPMPAEQVTLCASDFVTSEGAISWERLFDSNPTENRA